MKLEAGAGALERGGHAPPRPLELGQRVDVQKRGALRVQHGEQQRAELLTRELEPHAGAPRSFAARMHN